MEAPSKDCNTEAHGWIDCREKTPLNACSLEVLKRFKTINHELDENDDHDDSVKSSSITHHPLVIGCYQLNENGKDEENDINATTSSATRSGALLLHMIPSSLNDQSTTSSHLKFGEVTQVIHTSCGILDGKWFQNSMNHHNNYLYATACASGVIDIYQLQQSLSRKDTQSSFQLNLMASSVNSSSCNHNDNGLALSLAWDESANITDKETASTRIVSSYSKGSVAIHNFNIDNRVIEDVNRWAAHTLFGCAAEVWTVCFASNAHYSTYAETVISGGDDCNMKLWDLRLSCNKPIHCIGGEEFGAGVTTVSYHPILEHVFCSGSYDEFIRVWDMRKLSSSSEPIAKVDVKGGVWRTKWHPSKNERLLVAAMHGGCRILDIQGLSRSEFDFNSDYEPQITREFFGHKSMAYGADWIYDDKCEASASCSFYDRQAFIW